MFWRSLGGSNDPAFAVDEDGKLILANWEGDTTDYVLKFDEGSYTTNQRSNVNYPALNEWGNSPTKAALGGDNDVEITYKGQHYTMANDGSTFLPELSNYSG